MNQRDQVDDIAETLGDLRTSADELQEERNPSFEPKTVDHLQAALDEAIDAADELENQKK